MSSKNLVASNEISMVLAGALEEVFGPGRNWNLLVRKSGHFLGYMFLGLLLYSIIRKKFQKPEFFSLIILLILAFLDEFHQYFVEGRSASLADVFLDFLGGLAGLILYRFLIKIYTSRTK